MNFLKNQALLLKSPENVHIPSERTVYWVMEEIGLNHKLKRKPNGITKADQPLKKAITDISEIKAKDGKLYVSAIFYCYDLTVLGLALATNMKATLSVNILENAYPRLKGAIVHSDRGTQYTSNEYRNTIKKYKIKQSMNSAGGRFHDNAICESMWGRMKEELLYGRYNTKEMIIEEVKALVWRYFMSYWNNRRICFTNGGLPPMVKRARYYESLSNVA